MIALGANLGDPRAALRHARAELARLGPLRASRLYRTVPVGGPPGQPDYLNAAVRLDTDLPPRELLATLLAIETAAGRVRAERWGPRLLDLDLIAHGDVLIEEPGLSLPHPRAFARAFVLAPLAEVAPDWRHPGLGLSVQEALARLAPDALVGVEALDDGWAVADPGEA